MMSGGFSHGCDRLPLELTVCPCCGEGIKQSLGWTWIDPVKLLDGEHAPCTCDGTCPVCHPELFKGKVGLMWVGEKFYKTPEDFLKEGRDMGISKRIKTIPNDFKLGETYVLLAHPKAIRVDIPIAEADAEMKKDMEAKGELVRTVYKPGIFSVFKPARIEQLVQEKKATKTAIKKLEKRGITPVVVPDNDPDHFGSANDSKKKQKKLADSMAKKEAAKQSNVIPLGKPKK